MTPDSNILKKMKMKIGTPIAIRSLVQIKENPHRMVAVMIDI